MKPEQWQQVEQLYHAALDRAPDARAAFLAEACVGDDELRREVEALLRYDNEAETFMQDNAAVAVAQQLDSEELADTQSLLTGQQLGAYKILAPLGKGGMGEVHLALDTRLQRKVALKLLPMAVTQDAARVRRFAQEARTVSALSHPNILTIFDIGETDKLHYLVTEYIDGETLRQQMKRGKLSLEATLEIAVQVAQALAAAHKAGVIHRDIKPENVMVRKDGLVKVLDFGLAKLTEEQQDIESNAQIGSSTASGVIVGTPRYMSPEQARGEKVDARTDIFSLGVMLYEMLAHRAPFVGATASEVMAAILRDEPPPLADVAPALGKILQRALHKIRDERYRTAQELLADLQQLKQQMLLVATPGPPPVATPNATGHSARWKIQAIVAVLVVASAGFGLYRWLSPTKLAAGGPEPKVVPLTSFPGDESEPAFSPDGNRIAFVWRGPKNDNADIYVKQPGAEGLLRLTTDPAEEAGPAWSPDGSSLIFMRRSAAGSGIYLIPALGGGERKLTDVFNFEGRAGYTLFSPLQNPTWSADGKSILVVDKSVPQEPFSLFALTLDTGEKRRLTTPPAATYGDTSPAFSPDGKWLAFVRIPSVGVADVYLVPSGGGEPKQVTFGYQSVGRVAWTADSRELVFEKGPVVGVSNLWKVSVNGGAAEPIVAAGQMVLDPATSPVGHRLAYTQAFSDTNIWRLDLAVGKGRNVVPQEFIASTKADNWPEFSPDGKRIMFLSLRSGDYEIWVCGIEGENPIQLTELHAHTGTPHWSADSRAIVFDSRLEGNADIYAVSVEGGKPRRLTTDPAEDTCASWSRDGRWIYFGSTRSGSLQIWKMPAEGGTATQLTKDGGFEGFESPDGQFFYYAKGRGVPGIWRIPVAGGEEAPVLDTHQAGLQRSWRVVPEGIYFTTPFIGGRRWIEFFHFATSKVTQIAAIDKAFGNGLSVSPDGRWLIYAQIDRTGRDIMLMENFQ